MLYNNYGELKAGIAKHLDRNDMDAIIPDLIRLAAHRIFRRLRCPANEKYVVFAPTAHTNSIAIPSDYLEARALLLGDQIVPRTQIHSLKAGAQAFYRVRGRLQFTQLINYDPTDPPEINLYYYADYTDALNLDADSNPVLESCPELYLYGALIEAEPYLKNDERLMIWQDRFDRAMVDINAHARNAEVSGAPLQMKGIYQ